ncbi:proline/glycine betaine ABC transporter substrate-binding protein ProX [Roseovarius spongiae]|uniref:Proline/glycine betaine ABC transporter substrate-binding protein ProX n=1 Tax=Roseovarius spongiae TaxID=2320272 RepID=A0A3A8AT47_9RHOB|nr:glycine betaine/L-proline ABC transporter substrate-binding protein ProX [Roseovarius spongiae]RKF12578.1 proline/glycine betaine ABC transporter substrate-binding protein ProX [Roseovarius spongiae]
MELKRQLLAGLAIGVLAIPALAQDLPGEGKTVRIARNDSLGANYVQDEILISMIEDLGYDVELVTVGVAAFLQAAKQGDMDITADINMPQRAPQVEKVEEWVALVGDGTIGGGGINGYTIDKATSEKYDITSLEQLKDPELAKLFDSDGDGLANLINCDPGWSCGDVVDYQLEEFGLGDTVESIRAKYEPLMAEVFARYRQGDSVLYYTWSPSFVTEGLKPGEDVVWLPIPYDALPEGVSSSGKQEVSGVVGCAGGQDPCRMATGSWNWKIAANRKFLKENPAIAALAETVSWPLATWSSWEGRMKEDSSDRNIKSIADDWIENNRETYEDFVGTARKAATK